MIRKLLLVCFSGLILVISGYSNSVKIDRKSLIMRNIVIIKEFDPLASLSVGNGEFAFTTDLTGLQTFYKEYENGVPLGTQSNWGWHTSPNTQGYQYTEVLKFYNVNGRKVPYRHAINDSPRASAASSYLRENPHRLHLGLIGLVLSKTNGEPAKIQDIKNIRHQLDLWTGKISSNFTLEDNPVKVEVYCHQQKDQISVRIESPLVQKGRLAVQWKFPGASNIQFHPGYNFDSPESHITELSTISKNSVLILRKLDNDKYRIAINWKGNCTISETEKHNFKLSTQQEEILEFNCLFAPEIGKLKISEFKETKKNNQIEWEEFWKTGGAVDFSECTDKRAKELERRVVLSQYLTKIQSSGSLPPQETGLTYNSWFGKYHLEMHWWHIAHFANWQRPQYMLKQLDYYNKLYDKAFLTAKEQGYKGVRWQKMLGPDGENAPSSVGSYLIWQQPHLIWFAEQIYKSNPSSKTLKNYAKLIFATADFMADFAVWNSSKKQFDLGPPLIPAQEHWPLSTTKNPPYELAYWYWGLTKAQEWRQRLGMTKEEKWEQVRQNLAKPQIIDGFYPGIEGATNSYSDISLMRDHPSVLAAYGILPSWNKLDPEIMRKTMHLIAERWNWQSTWGWDYPMAAMTAVRLGEPERALEFLLKEVQKNTYLKNGHNYQDKRLTIYLPGNGGLLTTVAMMCAGWEGCSTGNPGFPDNGNWKVKWENLYPVF